VKTAEMSLSGRAVIVGTGMRNRYGMNMHIQLYLGGWLSWLYMELGTFLVSDYSTPLNEVLPSTSV
jgi:hypothetical protein